jgi:integrase
VSEARNARRAIARKRAAERMKMRHDHIVPLPKQAIAVLNESQSIISKGRYVFPSPARQKTPIYIVMH